MPNKPVNYFSSKFQLQRRALDHVSFINALYSDAVNFGVFNTTIFSDTVKPSPSSSPIHTTIDKTPDIVIANSSTVDCIMNDTISGVNPIVLNFASYKHPGGMFLEGSSAQEESLCHHSTLYNVLKQFPDYYEHNKENLNRHLYTNRALMSPILFLPDDGNSDSAQSHEKFATVITCAAPNFGSASKYCGASPEENDAVLKDRIKFIFDIIDTTVAEKSNMSIILGAFGCGVFMQDATAVAHHMVELINNGSLNGFRRVVFAIPRPENNPYNYDAFAKVLYEDLDFTIGVTTL